ncbi:Phenyloxazoline synthase MbtB [[Eubacterium] contortum]|uniref:Phenyloxazoline synthase MbtB n=2 Tax=Lachnospiraceae TaxID=186803 RepID=A0A174CWQ1_9FIRM|nr:non-ribosomal peptide synthetase [Faecalicatena contorta]CUO17593.1 Phenyloxazoline synthase MbtB [[Eubacterium] contortum] [Faecalicatena contorta]
MEYNEIKEQIKQKLPVEKEFGDSDNLLELGLSSIVIMRLVNQWRKQGVKVAFGTLMEHPTLNEWWEIIQKSMKKKGKKANAEEQVRMPERDMREPFPLTDVQYAYWAGREEGQPLGDIGCHAYLEFDGNGVEAGRLEAAWNQLQYHHSMLRACFTEDGMQKIQERPFSEKLPVNDYSKMLEEEAYRKAKEVRERLSHRKLQIEKGEVAGVELTLLPSGKTRIHIDMDLLIADVQSLQILLKDLAAAYNGEKLSEESKDWNFAAYLERQAADDREEKEKAKDYWRKRLDTLPKGPELPLAKRPEEVKKTVFHRRIVRIAKKEWEALQSKAKEYQTTPAMLLLTAYATVLERWSRNKRFLINIPFFNRKTEYQGMEEVIADFTTLLLLEVDCENNPTFLELLGRIQKQLHEDMKYTAYSGVQVQRDLTKRYGDASASAPVVFACNLGTPLVNERFKETLGTFSYMISQTPQVWNDFQSYEDEDGVQLTWDSVDALFPESMVDDMMKSFETLLHQLTEKSWNQRFDLLPESRREALEEMCRTGVPENPQCLHTAFLKRAEEFPQKAALEDTGHGKTITYRELKERAQAVAEHLAAEGIQKEPVAITLPRGYEQIVAALGILMSGNLYLPVSLNQPEERRKLIHEKTGVKYVITNEDWEKKITWLEETRRLILEEMKECVSEVELPKVMPEDSAYIIMTSGSTGIPKGVEIAHASAWNTIDDINKKYRVSKEDAALAVSAMDFDLSVYDLFGVLGAGGTLVLLPEEEKKNADYWLEQIKKYNITIWNSVPVLLDMLLVRAEAMEEQLPLRAVMLSGDWIGLDLPERVSALTNSCEFIAMGGATEASIWSNYQNVSLPLPENWKSIPYGRPLKHQAYRVVDEFGRDCPYWVEGELWIGGYGVAKGYRGDTELTEKKFVVDETGRWYRTGDLGRFWQDETIEFLGRQDHQVKIRGHRIELGETEHAIQGFPGVGNVVVDTFSDGHGNKSLAAYIEAEKKENSGVTDWKYGDSFLDSAWKKMKESVSDWMTLSDAEKNAQYETFLAYADQKCLHLMLTELERIGLLSRQTNGGFAVVPAAENKIVAEQKATVSRWLEILKKESILQKGLKEINLEVKPFGLPEAVEAVDTYFEKLQPYLEAMLIGKEKPLEVFYQKEADLAPNRLLSRIPGHSETIRELTEILEKLEEVPHNVPLQILEIGTRDADITREILHALEGGTVAYTYADSSKYFLEEARRELSEFEEIEFEQFSLDDSLDRQEIMPHCYDVIITANVLHRNHNAEKAVEKIAELLKPNGIFLMSELLVRTYLQDITAAFLENGFADIQDERKERGLVTPDASLWKEYFLKAGMGERLEYGEKYGRGIFCARQGEKVLEYSEEALRGYLLGKIPEYMVPQNYHFMEMLPSLPNGKINRKQLKEDFKGETPAIRISGANTETERKLLEIWKDLFGYRVLGIDDNYFTLGGDSLLATRLISEVQKTFGKKISISTIFETLTVRALARAIEQSEEKEQGLPQLQPDTENANEAFPLTDVQYAYWVGRSGVYDLGNVATHCYFELDAQDLDIERAEEAWNLLIQRHGMMRVLIQPDGKQRILKDVPRYQIAVNDIRELGEDEKEYALEEKREMMSHQIIQTENWPLFDVQITRIGQHRQRIHISFDNITFDGWSMFHILNEWAEIYRSQKIGTPITLSFRDYVLGLEKLKELPDYEADKKYWKDRLENFADAPKLPTAKNEKQVTDQKFRRRTAKLSREEWDSVKAIAGKIGVTPAVLLISAYAETLRLWSSNKDFTINLTQFDRKPVHPEVNELVGDFTTLTLLEVCQQKGGNFADRAKAIQQRLTEDLEHSTYSAVEFERELKKRTGDMQGVIMPVVFTSGLGIEQWNEGKWLGKLNYNISQTPQVWLDHQVVEMDGCLCLFWDAVEELFYPGMLDDMFHTYISLLRNIAENPTIVEEERNTLVKAEISEKRRMANETEKIFEDKTLDELFCEAAEKFPEKEAVVSVQRRMTYQELKEEALYICEKLQREGAGKGKTVAVLMEKGWEQVTAVYGILFAGAAYLPIDIHNPQERIEKILHDSETEIILTQQGAENQMSWLKKWKTLPVCGKRVGETVQQVKNVPEDLAYVIYTSGTTGMPKGVMISHRNAVNTILDINSRYQIMEKDTAFGISNLHFDLSVYDIFGLLSAGGTIVLPDPERVKDPAYWTEVLNTEKVTVWNSVPAFVEMLVEYEEYQKKLHTKTLRLVLMSGDWIPVSLPGRIRNIFDNVKILALGGATEASIWSNCFEVPEQIPEKWKSIPYGKPLANQRYYILNQNMENCPDWVSGDLYIAGTGVAQGYLNDEERTKEKFIVWETTGERLYSTGDMGRYWNSGDIEFLGRQDHQIKIGGYRIEKGEIESALKGLPQISEAIVEPVDNKQLVAFVCLYKYRQRIQEADKKFYNELDKIKEGLSQEEERIFLKTYGKSLEKISALIITETFIKMGIAEETYYTQEKFYRVLNVLPEFENLMETWKNVLIQEEVLQKENGLFKIVGKEKIRNAVKKELEEIQERGQVLNLYQMLEQSMAITINILRNKGGDVEALIQNKFKLLPTILEEFSPLCKRMTKLLLEIYGKCIKIKGNRLRVIEIGSRMKNNTVRYAELIKEKGELYYVDESQIYIKQVLKDVGVNNIKGITYDMREPYFYSGELEHKADIIIADNTLHRSYDIEITIANLKKMLKVGGVLIIREYTIPNRLIFNSVALLEKGFSKIKDWRRNTCMPLVATDDWMKLLSKAGFSEVISLSETEKNAKYGTGETIFVAGNYDEIRGIKESEILERLQDILPQYMLPERVYDILQFPLSPNGKVDRKKLLDSIKIEKDSKGEELKEDMTENEKTIANIWREVLQVTSVDRNMNFFKNGGDSLKAIKLVNMVKVQLGIEAKISWLFEAPTIAQFTIRIQNEASSKDYKEDEGEI